jgi:hypothetical protein
MPRHSLNGDSIEKVDRVINQLRDFYRTSYVTIAALARELRVSESALANWLSGRYRPLKLGRIEAFLSRHEERESGYQYRAYPVAPKPPRPCPFCRKARGEIRKVKGKFQGVCPNCGAMGPRRGSYDEALRAWNGKT